jgi:hypothetical protein
LAEPAAGIRTVGRTGKAAATGKEFTMTEREIFDAALTIADAAARAAYLDEACAGDPT